MLTQIRNALTARNRKLTVPHSKLREKICHILVKEQYLEACDVHADEKGRKAIEIRLRYAEDGRPAITSLRRVSKPGRRVYVGKREIPVVLNHFGFAILSTSQGLMTSREARRSAVGGEVLCEIS
jgi:small subunit ribosomal protein S8